MAPSKRPSKDDRDERPAVDASADQGIMGGNDGSISISIEETNRLRAQLGLKPLQVVARAEDVPVSVAPVLEAKPSAAQVRQRIEASRARRTRDQLVAEGGAIVDDTEAELDPAAWVARMRAMERQRPRQSRAKPQDDAESEEEQEEETDLANIRVTHRLRDLDLKAGDTITLTLKDSRLIDEAGDLREEGPDLLENPEVRATVDRRRRERERKQGAAYNPVEDEEEDEFLLHDDGVPKKKQKRDILAHYDEWAVEAKTAKKPKDGELKQGFALADLERHPANNPVDFPTPVTLTSAIGVQRDFMTHEEAAAVFKNPQKKKKKTILRRQRLQEEDEEPAAPAEVVQLAGKRPVRGAGGGDEPDRTDDDYLYEQLAMRRRKAGAAVAAEAVPDEVLGGPKPAAASAAAAVAEMVSVVTAVAEEAAAAPKSVSGFQSVGIVDIKPDEPSAHLPSKFELSGTTEFCRALRTPLEKLEDLKLERLPTPKLATAAAKRGLAAAVSAAPAPGQWRGGDETPAEGEGSESRGVAPESSSESEGEGITEEEKKVVEGILSESLLDGGIASALSYLKSRGELSLDAGRKGRKNQDNVPLHVSTNPKDVKLEYRDDYGRVMTPKEAFRYISWVFHGKGPGKRKREKLLKKMELEKKLKSLATNHSKLPTIRALQKQQKSTKQPYLVLTGSSSSASTEPPA